MIETTESFLKIEAVFNEVLDRQAAGDTAEQCRTLDLLALS